MKSASFLHQKIIKFRVLTLRVLPSLTLIFLELLPGRSMAGTVAEEAFSHVTPKMSRVISINLCTDQLLLLVGKPEQITSLSFLSHNEDISAMVDLARSHPVNHGLAEEILPLQPDLVLAGSYTSRYTVALLKEQGFNILVLEPARSLEDIISNLRTVGTAIGREIFTEKLIAQMLKHNSPEQRPERVLLYGASGTTSGSPSLGNSAITQAGLNNIATELGIGSWGYLSVEGLLRSNPDLIVFQRSGKSTPSMAQQLLNHPALSHSALPAKRLDLNKSELICGTPELFKASHAMHQRITGGNVSSEASSSPESKYEEPNS